MGFAVFFFAAWLILAVFSVIERKLPLLENTFIYLVMLIININWTWIIYEELKFIERTNEPISYTAFILYRSIIIPMILVTQLNLFYSSKNIMKSSMVVLGSIATWLLLSILSRHFNISNYSRWNMGYDILYILVLHGLTYYFHKFFQRFTNNEVKYS
ncbi:hypothetical protein J7E79_13480 [Bacillus sp. ISL-40]|uniref:hypothetical protein n=1 Tax=unclassified Bacillus (in: firmicutes) TaxID=185979 RepID=UPI001BECD7BC|nr:MULTISPECIES: hypothetical protein [unclassified Bacillus (in: firmicutes)]MBT2698423.1 hypothetical protein [Bacillus sp. ISL-40]MBT2722120.1 hypothetical protein [Bacillus sp. ISL-46]MBT2740591.1 hypothetical protein [Bacillus sp. ISL-77]